jgi:tRNA nucleotidyltransferase (CCA-adding enzyme)
MDVITTHKGTDFDALACVVAATLIFPDATACLPETLNPNVRSFISLHKDQFAFIRTRDVDIQHVHRLIVVDANRWHRLELSDALREKKAWKSIFSITMAKTAISSRTGNASAALERPLR